MKTICIHFIKRRSGFFSLSLVLLSSLLSFHVGADADYGSRPPTFCNPLDIPYRFQFGDPVRREAADPTMVIYKNEYWLFPSKSGGYWHSPDCLNWTYVPSKSLPIEAYAPSTEVVNGRMLWTAWGTGIWANDDPTQDTWKKVGNVNDADPDLFLSDEGRLFFYGSCSTGPTNGVELDVNTLEPIGKRVRGASADPGHRGWETLGPGKDPWIEGSWMTEHDGTYYLQYAAPGTEVDAQGMLKDGDAYQDVIEVSDDGATWNPCIDKSQNQIDVSHDYVQLPAPVPARYVRLTNVHCPAGAKLSVSGFRIFGHWSGTPSARVEGVTATRLATDPRQATVSRSLVKDADLDIVRYGIATDKLFSNYQVCHSTEITFNALNAGVPYVVAADTVNDSGVTQGTQGVPIP